MTGQLARTRIGVLITAAVSAAALGLAAPAAGTTDSGRGDGVSAPGASHPTTVPACGQAAPMHARCMALVRTDPATVRLNAAADDPADLPGGYGPADLAAAYNLPTDLGAGQTIAIVDAFDDPTAEADLAVYRETFGLPPCTSASGCFAKVNQDGAPGPYPPVDGGWAAEESLDVDMVSAACPQCNIVLVEADTNSISDLAAAVNTAAGLGAVAISNSYGTNEFGSMDQFAASYDQPGTTVTVSSGDFGFGPAQFPAVLDSVIAVGGTSLTPSTHGKRGWTETAWSGAGSGCSAYITKPAWQHDRHCLMRTTADVSAVADPNTGLAVYDTTPNPFGLPPGWLIVGGTSASAPLIAGIIGLAGNGGVAPSYPYEHAGALNDVIGGSNGFCGKDYLCTGKRGYDGPTGLGTPNGIGAL